MRVASIVEHCAERAQAPGSPRNLHQRREDEIMRECDEKHPFTPSITKTSVSHPQKPRAGNTTARLYQSWRSTIEARREKIVSAEVEKREVLAQQIRESRALPEVVAQLHLKKNRRILQEREERGDFIKRHTNLGPDVDDEWTASPFSRAVLMHRIFLRLADRCTARRACRDSQSNETALRGSADVASSSTSTDREGSMFALELWKFLKAMNGQLEVEADDPWTASGFERIEQLVGRTEEVLGWQWKNSEGVEDEEDGERPWDVLESNVSAEEFQAFLDSPEVWKGRCPDDEALYTCYRNLLTQTRPRLVKELFQKLDVDGCRVLRSKHLLHFARLYGFQGDEREWAWEFEDLRQRFHWGEQGAARGHLAALVSTRDPGKVAPCYFCSSLRIDYILAQLEKHPPRVGDSRHISMQPFTYAASQYTSSVEFSPLSSRRESPRWRPPSPSWRGQASPGSVGSPSTAGSLRSPAWSPRSASSFQWPAEEPASIALKDASLDSYHQLLGNLKIPSAADILSGSGPVSARS